jgi:CarboxypepD_reg-like domain
MKYLLLLSILLASLCSDGQNITGTVVDKTTKLPISGATVSVGFAKIHTNSFGKFEIATPVLNDSLKVVHFAYKTYVIITNKAITTLFIELQPKVISLNEVVVRGDRDFKKDSINNRIEYAKQFNYTGPKVMDTFTGNPNKQPGELISINPLVLIATLTKKSTPEYKFNKILIRDEQADYIDRKFNRGVAAQATGLKGDTLKEFLIRYRPTYQFAKKSTDYEMDIYIKDSYKQFKKERFKVDDNFLQPTGN